MSYPALYPLKWLRTRRSGVRISQGAPSFVFVPSLPPHVIRADVDPAATLVPLPILLACLAAWVSDNLSLSLLFVVVYQLRSRNSISSVATGGTLRLSGACAMSTASQHHDVSVLSAAKNGLVYLTPNDWALIVDKAVRMKFRAGENLVQKGKRTHGLYLVLNGVASVQIAARGTSLEVSAGEVCGEISFLDELPATAEVIAKEAVEAYYLDRTTLLSLFELFPHLGSRFYHSLAGILSRRLRELIGPAVPAKPVSSPKLAPSPSIAPFPKKD